MKKKIFLIFSLFLVSLYFFTPFNVYAYYIVDPSSRLVPTEYDPTVSVFDKYGYDINLISNCSTNYYLDFSTSSIVYSTPSSGKKLCSSSSGLTLDDIKDYFKYYIHINYRDKVDGDEYDTYLVFINQPYVLRYESNGYLKSKLVDSNGSTSGLIGMVIINHYAYSEIHFTSDEYESQFQGFLPYNLDGNTYSGITYLNGFIDWYDTDYNHDTFLFNEHQYYDINALISLDEYDTYLDLSFTTNFNLSYYGSDNVIINGSDGYNFNTDTDIVVPSKKYALLIPKKNTTFTSRIWTDSNFLYSLVNYDLNYNPDNSTTVVGSLDSISYGALNDFKWFNWDFTFNTSDINNHRVLQIFNHNEETDLNLKISSSDFYYTVLSSNSDGFCVNNFCYNNNFNYLNEISSHHVINNVYDIDELHNNIDYINSLKNYLPQFKNAFIFVGSCITAIFSVFNTEIASYFYIIFGLMIVMLIINIMK